MKQQLFTDNRAVSEPSILNLQPETSPCMLVANLKRLSVAGWSARAFECCYPVLLQQVDQLLACERYGWQQGLRQLWCSQGWGLKRCSREALLTLAYQWQDWPLVDALCEQQDENGWITDQQLLYWSQALFQLGTDQAFMPLQRYLLANPHCLKGEQLYHQINEQDHWLARSGLQQLPQDETLLLMPLQHHHREAFMWQYHDQEIAELCCLPTFTDDEQWHCWLDTTYGYGDQQPLAIIHRDWGFIGVVSLTLHQGVGFVYYWLSSDFRGQNLAPQAVSLLMNHAHQYWGLERCYAKLFDFNHASRRVLEKVGFVDLGISALAPDEQEVFYRLGEEQSYRDSAQELHQLLNCMGSDVRIANLLVV